MKWRAFAFFIMLAGLAPGQSTDPKAAPSEPVQAAPAPAEKEVLRVVTPGDRHGAGDLYWHFASQMNRGAMFSYEKSPIVLMTVDFRILPLEGKQQPSALVTVKTVLKDNRAEPKSFWDVREAVRTVPYPLAARMQKAWDAALATARVSEKPYSDTDDPSHPRKSFELRGGEPGARIVAEAVTPESGVPLALDHLIEILLVYCGVNGDEAPLKDAEYVEETVRMLEEATQQANAPHGATPPKASPTQH